MKLKDRIRGNDDDVDVVERGKIGKKVVDLPSPGMKQKKLKRKPRTVPPPVEEVMLAYRKMSDDEKRDYIRIGHRVKVSPNLRIHTCFGCIPGYRNDLVFSFYNMYVSVYDDLFP